MSDKSNPADGGSYELNLEPINRFQDDHSDSEFHPDDSLIFEDQVSREEIKQPVMKEYNRVASEVIRTRIYEYSNSLTEQSSEFFLEYLVGEVTRRIFNNFQDISDAADQRLQPRDDERATEYYQRRRRNIIESWLDKREAQFNQTIQQPSPQVISNYARRFANVTEGAPGDWFPPESYNNEILAYIFFSNGHQVKDIHWEVTGELLSEEYFGGKLVTNRVHQVVDRLVSQHNPSEFRSDLRELILNRPNDELVEVASSSQLGDLSDIRQTMLSTIHSFRFTSKPMAASVNPATNITQRGHDSERATSGAEPARGPIRMDSIPSINQVTCGENDQQQLFLFSVRSENLIDRFAETVATTHFITQYDGDIIGSEAELDGLWGSSLTDRTTTEYMNKGDIALFYTQHGVYSHYAKIIDRERNVKALTAAGLCEPWQGSGKEGDRVVKDYTSQVVPEEINPESFVYAVYLTNIGSINIQSADLHDQLGYNKNHPVSKVQRVASSRLELVRDLYPSVEAFLQDIDN